MRTQEHLTVSASTLGLFRDGRLKGARIRCNGDWPEHCRRVQAILGVSLFGHVGFGGNRTEGIAGLPGQAARDIPRPSIIATDDCVRIVEGRREHIEAHEGMPGDFQRITTICKCGVHHVIRNDRALTVLEAKVAAGEVKANGWVDILVDELHRGRVET